MFGIHVAAAAQAARRALPLGLTAILLTSALGASVPARAQDTKDDPNAPAPARTVRDHRGEDHPRWTTPSAPAPDAPPPIVRDHRDPYARIQLVIKSITIHNDMDWGDGEFDFAIRVHVFDDACAGNMWRTCGTNLVQAGLRGFSGSAGKVKQFDRVVPADGDTIDDRTVAASFSIPIREDVRHGFTITGIEIDPSYDDSLGGVSIPFTGEAGQIRFGTHSQRAFGGCVHSSPIGVDFCLPDRPDTPTGGFEVEYEIRPVPLPDLRPTGFWIAAEAPGDRDDQVCFAVENRGVMPSEPFRVSIAIGGAEPPVSNLGAFGLAAGETREQCTGIRLPDSGLRPLTLTVDQERVIAEIDDRNNSYERLLSPAGAGDAGPIVTTGNADAGSGTGTGAGSWQAQGPFVTTTGPAAGPPSAAVPSPEPVASQASSQPDLTVGAIRVRDQVPDGKDDCKDGKHDVAVVVRNAGTAKAGAFVVRLTVDGDGAREGPVDGLETGKQQEIRFDDVRLKKGERSLTATVDPKDTVAESSESNNTLEVIARCKDDV